jgi:hypothetical protein
LGIETIVFAAATAASVGSSVAGIQQQQKANKNAARAADLQRRQQELAAARSRRDMLRRTRQSAAIASQTAANQGVSESSSAIGGQASIFSQFGSEVSFLDTQNTMSRQIGAFESAANRATSRAQLFGGISDIAAVGAKNSKRISNIFGAT